MENILLEVKDLCKLYSNRKGITNVSFAINSSEIVGFIGPNGAGKSTTLKTIVNLLKKDSGEVRYFGRELDKNFVEIMEFVGYMSSDDVAYENMTAKNFLKYAASFYQIDYQDNIQALAKRLDLDMNSKIGEMSLGNKKKVGIIAALFHEPKVILLDEPTSGLDPLIQLEFLKILKEYQKKGSAIFFSSHVLSEVETVCNRIIIIKNGSIIQEMNINELQNTHKKIYIQSRDKIEEKQLNISNMKSLHLEGNKANFLFAGDINVLVKKLNSLDLVDVTIVNPSLEELFLHYYD